MWQADSTPWQLADSSPGEILNLLDDHSRLAVVSTCFGTLKGLDAAAANSERITGLVLAADRDYLRPRAVSRCVNAVGRRHSQGS
ncbi:MAG: hypothetical protein ACREOS_07280, partial [Candidatus Dormibacteraceae bacterium]